MISRNNQPGDVRDVGHQIRAAAVRNFTRFFPINDSWIRRRADDDKFWLMLFGERHHLIKVHVAVFVAGVLHRFVVTAGEIDRQAVSHVAAKTQTHTHERFARVEQSEHHCDVGGATGSRLDVGVIHSK